MAYEFDFAPVFAQRVELLDGVLRTLQFSGWAMALGLLASILGVLARTSRSRVVVGVTRGYVELIRNTPFVVQLFFLYFSLPMIGIEIDADTAALIALVTNFAGYGIEILRAGIQSIPRGQIEAAEALGMRKLQIFRKIVLFPAIGLIYPSLVGQFILLFLNTSVLSVISAEELSAVVSNIQSVTFRSFEAYVVATFIYLALAVAFQGLFAILYRVVFLRGRTGRAA